LEDVDDERGQILEEEAELNHIWDVWEAEKEPTNAPRKWIRQPSQSGNDMRHHVEVHASHREKEWESPSASLTKRSLEFIGGDKDKQMKQLWEGTRIGDILPWDEI
jgi:hypothetical protein